MTKLEAGHDAQVTFRLPSELDLQMRATSDYFRRSLTEEWRAAAVVYQRLVERWAATRGAWAAEGPTEPRECEAELVAELGDGLLLEPRSLEDLRNALAILERKERR